MQAYTSFGNSLQVPGTPAGPSGAGEAVSANPRAELKRLNRVVVAAFSEVLEAQVAGADVGEASDTAAASRVLQEKLAALEAALQRINGAINALRPRQAHEILLNLMTKQRDTRAASAAALEEACTTVGADA